MAANKGQDKKEKNTNKEKIAELKMQKKQMQEELDELNGRTAKGKAMCALICVAVIALLLGGMVAMVKLDVGGFASTTLAPVIADVPVIRSILPKDLQKKTAGEIAAEEQAAQQAAQTDTASNAQADTTATEKVTSDTQTTSDTQAVDTQVADTQTTDTQPQTDTQTTAAGQSQTNGQNTAGTQSQTNGQNAAGTQSQTNGQNTAGAQSQANAQNNTEDTQSTEDAQAISDAALKDYVDTYTNMKPKDAATVFDTMMPDQMLLITKILKEMTPAQRSAILSKMDAQNASDITVEMNKELP